MNIRVCRAVLFAALACVSIGSGASDSVRPAPITGDAAVRVAEGLPPEVRLRKLHLVRPDLIPYPIAYEVVC